MEKKGRVEIPLGEAPKERDAKGEGARGHSYLVKRKGSRASQALFLWPDDSVPHQRPSRFIPKPGEHKQRDEKVEFLFTLADRNLNLSNPLRTKDLKPLMS